MKKILKIWSYLNNVHVDSIDSQINGGVEVSLENGKKVLNSAKTNYSFGSLEQVFKSAFLYFSPKWSSINDVLILGYGGGSIAKLLYEEKLFKGNITAVEKDEKVLKMAHKHFGVYLNGVDMVVGDAEDFIEQQSQPLYDIIFTDIFIQDIVPPYFYSEGFVNRIQKTLKPEGMAMQNFMFKNKAEKEAVLALYRQCFSHVKSLDLHQLNTVICAQNI